MKDIANKLLGLIVTLGVAASLAFGAATAMAMAAGSDECQDDGYNFFGECVTPTFCDSQCRFVGGDYGYCDDSTGTNCCLCVH